MVGLIWAKLHCPSASFAGLGSAFVVPADGWSRISGIQSSSRIFFKFLITTWKHGSGLLALLRTKIQRAKDNTYTGMAPKAYRKTCEEPRVIHSEDARLIS